MADIRYRILTAAILSITAFLSVAGAVAAIIWWLIFAFRLKRPVHAAAVISAFLMIAVVAAALQILDGTGLSYGVRMGAVLLVAVWVCSEQQPEEYLSFWVWLLGHRIGFELGMVTELGIQAFDEFLRDLRRMRDAWALKGTPLRAGSLPAAGMILIHGALARAGDTAEILAVRGYRSAGSHCPAFRPTATDVLQCLAAVLAGLLPFAIATVPVGEFFILLH
jgi:energy-coupling factor transport system permease protein